MKVLSLFDGISAGQLALQRANKKVDQYYASEIDKYAIKVTQRNFPNTIQLGDVTKWKEWDIPWGEIDLVMGGSPCQGFSFAGKQLNFDDPRSALFFVFVDICHHVANHNPKMRFLLENVRMKKESQDVITGQLGVEPIVINSNLVSAQNRHRLYWTNIPNVTQPTDREILLRDILQDSVDNKYYLTEAGKAYMSRLRNGKPRWEYHTNPLDGKAACVTANFYVGIPMGVLRITGAAQRGRYSVDGVGNSTEQRIEFRNDNKSNCLTSVQKDSLVGIDDTICRRLTPVECERLQTFPDNYTDVISNTQRYKALGNSWTVDVITHIFKNL